MTKKFFAVIVIVWLISILAIFARATPVGLAKSNATCMEAKITQALAEVRLGQLVEQVNRTEDPSVSTVLKAEVEGVYKLKRIVELWLVENCREA
jgi:preprotein translocase subunit SecF